MEIVKVVNNEPATSTLIIAGGTNIKHKNVIGLIREYLADFETYGRVAFETAPFETSGGTQEKSYAILNEPQAMLLLTYMRNSEVVRKFKQALVKEFHELRQAHLAKFNLPRTLPAALRALADAEERNEQLKLTGGEATLISHLAQRMNVSRPTMIALLESIGWIFKRASNGYAATEYGKLAGFVTHKSERGNETQVRITNKGRDYLLDFMNRRIEA